MPSRWAGAPAGLRPAGAAARDRWGPLTAANGWLGTPAAAPRAGREGSGKVRRARLGSLRESSGGRLCGGGKRRLSIYVSMFEIEFAVF